MSAPSHEQFKQQLLDQRQSLLTQLAQLRGGASRVDAAGVLRNTVEDAHDQVFSERELELILDDRETVELQAIAAALQRIQDGSYGVCADCGADIPGERLAAAPAALRCIACQTRTEAH
jgi:DnaK suppressor protein